jgi:hypothetical protein
MKRWESVFWVACGVILVVVCGAVFIFGAWAVSPWGCDSRWEVQTDWSITAGCRVWSDVDGWVPEDNYRVLE